MNPTERIKLLSMAGMLTLVTSLTIYFHAVLHSGLVFTHLFYLPVILGGLWWGRKGLGIAIYLGLMLMVCHWSIRPDTAGPNDYFRAVMFVVVSLLVLMMRTKILASEAALKQQSSELQQRVQALSCLYAINRLREKKPFPCRIFSERRSSCSKKSVSRGCQPERVSPMRRAHSETKCLRIVFSAFRAPSSWDNRFLDKSMWAFAKNHPWILPRTFTTMPAN